MRIAAKDFSAVAVEQRLELNYISVRELVPFRDIVFDQEVTLESNWLGGNAYNETTSFDFFTGTSLVGFSTTNLSGQFSVAHLNVQSQQLGDAFYVMHEKLRIDFHSKFAEASSISFNWQATVFVSSHAGANAIVRPSAFFVTKHGSLAQRGQAVTDFALPAGEWLTGRGTVTLSSSSINTNSYPGPYYVVPGMIAKITGAPTSYALAGMYMDRIG